MAARWMALAGLAGFVALAACGPSGNSNPAPGAPVTTTDTATPTPTPDAAFVGKAAMFENFEIQAATLATSQAQTQAVKTYAANEAAAHRQALHQLTALAEAGHIPMPPADLDDNYRAYIDMLTSAHGAAFDSTYPAQQALAYINASGTYQTYAAVASDGPLKQWAATRLTTLQGEVTAARALASAH